MSDIVTCKVTGLAQLQKALEALPPKVARSLERKAIREPANIVAAAMADAAPDDTGLLREHFGVKITTKGFSKYGILGVKAFIGGKTAIYYPPEVFHKKLKQAMKVKWHATINTALHFLEFGTSKEPKRPFLSRAWESVKDEVLAKIVENLREALGL